MSIIYPISLPTAPGPAQLEWSAETVAGRNISPYTLAGESFEWPGNRWRCSVRYPRMTRAQAEPLVAALVSLYGVGTFLLGPAGPGKTAKGVATGTPLVNGANQAGKTLLTKGWTANISGILNQLDYFQLGGENFLIFSEQLNNAAWIPSSSGAADPIVTPDAVADPNGVIDAEQIAYAATAAGQYSGLKQTLPNIAPKPEEIWTFSIWMKASVAQSIQMILEALPFTLGSGSQIANVTTSWQRFSVSFTFPAGLITGVDVQLRNPASSAAQTIFTWGAQLERGASAGPYTQTTSTGITIRRLYTVLARASSDAGGLALLDIWPRLREMPANSSPIIVASPKGLFRLVQPSQKWDIDQAYLHGLTFEAEEAI